VCALQTGRQNFSALLFRRLLLLFFPGWGWGDGDEMGGGWMDEMGRAQINWRRGFFFFFFFFVRLRIGRMEEGWMEGWRVDTVP